MKGWPSARRPGPTPWPGPCWPSRSTAPSPSSGEAPITGTRSKLNDRRLWSGLAAAAAVLATAALAQDAGALRGELQAKSLARDDARIQAQNLRAEIAKLSAQLGELNAVASAGAKTTADRRARLDALNQREEALRQEMGSSQAELGRLLGALELYRRQAPPALLVTPRSAQDAVRAAILIRAIEPELEQRASVLRARAEELTRLRRSILAASEDLMTSESALAENRSALEEAIQQKSALERQLDADVTDYSHRAQVLAGQLRALRASPDVPAPAPADGRAPDSLLIPAQGALERRFGQAAAGAPPSDGLYWRTAPGASVRAPASGVVEFSGPLKGWGGVLIIDAGGGYRVVLAGLDRIGAPVGRRLAAGQQVASMAQAPSPQLYLELRKGEAPVDPSRWLR
jgi:septal ring factor EnvC (AmiA/AmiB activator)